MKNLLTFLAVILCSVGAFGQGAQYRPTPFANGFVQTVTSQGTAQTYLGIGSSTNNALLNGTNVFTGTNTFRAEDQPFVLLYSTNLFVASVPFVTATPTNNGDYRNTTGIVEVQMPPLTATNDEVTISFCINRTNGQPVAGGYAVFVGDNTNYIYSINNQLSSGAAVGRSFSTHPGTRIFQNYGSLTNQIQMQAGSGGATYAWPSNLVNTATNWWLRIGLFVTTSGTNTNYFVENLRIWKVRNLP